jgi:hypothetical protein
MAAATCLCTCWAVATTLANTSRENNKQSHNTGKTPVRVERKTVQTKNVQPGLGTTFAAPASQARTDFANQQAAKIEAAKNFVPQRADGAVPHGPPANDDCAGAIPVLVPSVTAGSTLTAALDAVAACGTTITAPGVWYSFTGTGNTVTVTTCDAMPATGYDTKLNVYTDGCGILTCVTGNDDGGTPDCAIPSGSLYKSRVTFCSIAGQEYLVLVQGFGGSIGDFNLSVSDDGVPCAVGGGEDCCVAHPTPGCSDPVCQAAICAADPFCCDVQWDGICANAANNNPSCAACFVPCPDVICGPTDIPENEPDCGLPIDTVNGGCNSNPNVFSPIECGQTYCGTGAFDGATRDTDWYQVVTLVDTELVWTVNAEFDALIGIVDNNGIADCAGVSVFQVFAVGPCGAPITVSACLPPGSWWLFAAPDFAGGPVVCGAEYTASLVCNPCVVPTGACCHDGGTCTVTSAIGCENLGGTYGGDGTTCTPSPCPPNDDCPDAIVVGVPSTTPGSTSLATPDAVPACNTPAPGSGIWYKVIGTGNTITISTCNDTGGGSNCCFSHAGPGCDDPVCQDCVCLLDPFCCNTAWDGICAGEAANQCAASCPCGGGGLGPDDCAAATPVTPGTPINGTTVGATNDGTIAGSCGASDASPDVWYDYTAGVTGITTVSLCGSLYDCVAGVWTACPGGGGGVEIACNDDFCGLQSQLTFAATSGTTYKIRVSGFAGSSGTYTLNVSEGAGTGTNYDTVIEVYQGECDSLCCVTGNDDACALQSEVTFCSEPGKMYFVLIGGFAGQTGNFVMEVSDDGVPCSTLGCQITCDPDKTLENEPDCGIPVDTVNGGCNSPIGLSNCCFAHAGVGCDDPACQATVCALDPFCCDVAWDGICAGEAATNCGGLCAVTPTFPFSEIACGQEYCGTAANRGDLRDTDWYRINLTGPTFVTWCVNAEFSAALFIITPNPDCNAITIVADGVSNPCEELCISACLEAGEHYLFVATSTFSGTCCDKENTDYNARVTCGECPGACCNPDCPFTCVSLTSVECTALGWTPIGPNTVCAGASCVATATCCLGDVDNNGSVDENDIDEFVTAIITPAACGTLEFCASNFNQAPGQDEVLNGLDIQGFVNKLLANQPFCSNCCIAHGGLGCDNPECQAIVCAMDPFCCDVAWDGICADEASTFCVACGGDPNPSNCCFAHAGTGCDCQPCQDCVCALDPFCCDTAWDGICAGEAQNQCAASCPCGGNPCEGGGGPPANDDCSAPSALVDGLNAFTTVGATTDGPAFTAGPCIAFGSPQINQDVWYTYTASCTGTLTLELCDDGAATPGSAGYDSKIAVYNNVPCPVSEADSIGCNDDGVGCANFSSFLQVSVTSGTTYLVRVGAFAVGVTGSGNINITCTP